MKINLTNIHILRQTSDTFTENQKINSIRKIYKKGVKNPMVILVIFITTFIIIIIIIIHRIYTIYFSILFQKQFKDKRRTTLERLLYV